MCEDNQEETIQVLGVLLQEARRVARELLARADYVDVWDKYVEKYPWLKEND